MERLILIGDSIRMGYEAHVKQALTGLADVWSPTENGGNSANVLTHLNAWVFSRLPAIVHLNCGLHDLKRAFDAPHPEIPLDQYETNVRAILEGISRQDGSIVIWATTTPVNETWHHRRKGFDRFEADVLAYNRVANDIAASLDVSINDLYSVVMSNNRDALLGEDGVHFNPSGDALLGEAVIEAVKPFLTRDDS